VGANFAHSDFFTCSVDGTTQPCAYLSPNLALLNASSPDGATGSRPITVTNGGDPSSPVDFTFALATRDLQRGLVQHYVKGVPTSANTTVPLLLPDRNLMPRLAASMTGAAYPVSTAAGDDSPTTACVWMKLDMVQPEGSPFGAGLLPAPLRFLGGWSQVSRSTPLTVHKPPAVVSL
jgi:hypothetical protein